MNIQILFTMRDIKKWCCVPVINKNEKFFLCLVATNCCSLEEECHVSGNIKLPQVKNQSSIVSLCVQVNKRILHSILYDFKLFHYTISIICLEIPKKFMKVPFYVWPILRDVECFYRF